MARVLTGASGFQHSGWDESYYPPDIPADWKLAFYANDFTAILLPEFVWRETSHDDLEQWLEDIDEGFRVYLRVSCSMPDLDECGKISKLLAPYFAGFFIDQDVKVDANELFPKLSPDINWLLSQQHRPKDENDSIRYWIRYWGQLESIDHRVNAVVIQSEMDKRKLRQAIEKIEPYLDTNNDVLVLYDVSSPVAQDLKDLRILLELMAIA